MFWRRSLVILAVAGAAWLAAARMRAQAPVPSLVAPQIFSVVFHTTSGTFVIEAHRDWAPHGADRFYTLARSGFYDGNAFYRVIPGFVAQWGLNPDPSVSARWARAAIPDDPVLESNLRGMVSFATSGRNSRCTEIFVNLSADPKLDGKGFAPFGRVTAGLSVLDRLYSEYGETPPQGTGPDPHHIVKEGAAYLTKLFPRLDVVTSTQIKAAP